MSFFCFNHALYFPPSFSLSLSSMQSFLSYTLFPIWNSWRCQFHFHHQFEYYAKQQYTVLDHLHRTCILCMRLRECIIFEHQNKNDFLSFIAKWMHFEYSNNILFVHSQPKTRDYERIRYILHVLNVNILLGRYCFDYRLIKYSLFRSNCFALENVLCLCMYVFTDFSFIQQTFFSGIDIIPINSIKLFEYCKVIVITKVFFGVFHRPEFWVNETWKYRQKFWLNTPNTIINLWSATNWKLFKTLNICVFNIHSQPSYTSK